MKNLKLIVSFVYIVYEGNSFGVEQDFAVRGILLVSASGYSDK